MGSPIEKIKLEKDGSSAWTDVYEYAKKIREGTMTWEEVESAGEILAEPS
jgi:ferredoxin-nitrite reductase